MSGWSLKKLFGRSPEELAVRESYVVAVEQARQPGFYRDWQVPDSAIGRFDVIALHAFFVLHRLKGEEAAIEFSTGFCDAIFDDMDRNLREMGVGDLSVGKKVRKLAEGFYGRAEAYEQALSEDDSALQQALVRNLFGAEKPDSRTLDKAVSYVRRNVAVLAAQNTDRLMEGQIEFAPLEEEDF